MILSEYERRWVEVRFYHFIIDIYKIRNKIVDITDMVETICLIARIEINVMKKVVNQMLNDAYYQPQKREILLLGHIHGVSDSNLAKYYGVTRQSVFRYIKNNLDNYTPIPRCNPDVDRTIKEFLVAWDRVRKAGFYDDNTNKSTI